MTKDLKLPHDGLVLVSDGRKALFIKNKGDDLYPNLQVERVLEAPDNLPTRQQGTDKQGQSSTAMGQRSAIEQTDWHELAERKFAGEVAEAVNAACFNGGVKHLIVAAPPRTLAELRNRFSDHVKQKILAEVNKDLTKHPVYEIEQHLMTRA
ncbi:protein required for attachment to host cells [Microvirga flocculans]|uniref:Protein required for attachment to host cells n=1 Tax=Microvirga flocculans TaxID=217168 RepID=A0A7W6ICS6_9HYPH|nr:host attachment family protein [Microvirga flocculans]MBB4038605.1 protein required for attachment to host cells [Microvirga flocculans]